MFDKKDANSIKVIDWGTSRKFDPKQRMKRLVGTVQLPPNLTNPLTLAVLPCTRGPQRKIRSKVRRLVGRSHHLHHPLRVSSFRWRVRFRNLQPHP